MLRITELRVIRPFAKNGRLNASVLEVAMMVLSRSKKAAPRPPLPDMWLLPRPPRAATLLSQRLRGRHNSSWRFLVVDLPTRDKYRLSSGTACATPRPRG